MKKTAVICILSAMICSCDKGAKDTPLPKDKGVPEETPVSVSEAEETVLNAPYPVSDGDGGEIISGSSGKHIDVNDASPSDTSVFLKAVRDNDTALLNKMLLNGFDINTVDKNGLGAVAEAVMAKQYDVLQYLLDKGAEANIASEDILPPLSLAIFGSDEKALDILLKSGKADIDFIWGDYWNNSALYAAVYKGETGMLDILINAGADINSDYSESGAPPILLYAVRNKERLKSDDYKELIAYMILKGADINKGDSDGITPLMQAVGDRNIDVFNALIVSKADIKARDKRGRSALDIAADLKKRLSPESNAEDLDRMIEFVTP